ncbi:MAG TPA: type 2 isopentenyl-diphosphate Delta-isomerase [Thermoanaerobaculia bacterium]|jgi:isopentenyl-diphosphate delta-isomerase|nr:type 2 isopentenyl-diphosphate Delta-isomerase [Thermoanaerobaculia bacterium]
MPEPQVTDLRDRKAEHLRLALEAGMQHGGNFFDDWSFEHDALPELDAREIDTGVEFLGKRLAAPLLISSMTGGTPAAARINRHLALAAERQRLAMGVGSQRRALEDPRQAATFQVREVAPTAPLLANLGAVQLNYGYGVAQCVAAVEMIGADALVLHLNPLQEALQPEGQGDFRGLLAKIGEVARALPVPLIVKEVGCGLSRAAGERLLAQGVRILDTAGLGGTSWARIEARRGGDAPRGELFADWGIPTPESIRALASLPEVTVIGSGGVRNGVDAAKALALGAHLVGIAQPLLAAAMESAEAVEARLAALLDELRICMFCVGARTIEALRRTPIALRRRR